MVRRVASQVHKQASRLMAADYVKDTPNWYGAVLEYPPIPLPARKAPARTDFDLPTTSEKSKRAAEMSTKTVKPRQLPIVYLEDEVRRQFFRDHPFEAFRPRSLVERGQVDAMSPVRGKSWMRLSQRTRLPSSEDAVQFAVNLYEHSDDNEAMSLSTAYSMAIAQFRALRSEHHITSSFAVREAEHYGHQYNMTTSERAFVANDKAILTWNDARDSDEASRAQKRWKAIVEKEGDGWSRGENYVRLWKEGVRPAAAPSLTEPLRSQPDTRTRPESMSSGAEIQDAMNVVHDDIHVPHLA